MCWASATNTFDRPGASGTILKAYNKLWNCCRFPMNNTYTVYSLWYESSRRLTRTYVALQDCHSSTSTSDWPRRTVWEFYPSTNVLKICYLVLRPALHWWVVTSAVCYVQEDIREESQSVFIKSLRKYRGREFAWVNHGGMTYDDDGHSLFASHEFPVPTEARLPLLATNAECACEVDAVSEQKTSTDDAASVRDWWHWFPLPFELKYSMGSLWANDVAAPKAEWSPWVTRRADFVHFRCKAVLLGTQLMPNEII